MTEEEYSLNRTFMELKLECNGSCEKRIVRLNRTFMELKSRQRRNDYKAA